MISLMLPPQPVNYRGTITGLRISAVDGTAFIDGATSAVTDLADGNHSIEIYDSSNRMIKGVLKAAGASEGLGSTLNVSDCVNGAGIYAYDTFESASASGFHAHKTGTTNEEFSGTADELALVQHGLFKTVINGTITSGDAPTITLRDSLDGTNISWGTPPTLLAGTNNYYCTITTTATGVVRFRNSTASVAVFTVADLATARVLTPSSSGATIVSAKAGETYNFAYKNSSFVFNAASYFCIIRKIR